MIFSAKDNLPQDLVSFIKCSNGDIFVMWDTLGYILRWKSHAFLLHPSTNYWKYKVGDEEVCVTWTKRQL